MAPRAAAHILRKLMLPGLVTIAAALMLVGATGPLSPTGPQLRYQSDEIVALIHFNMATFFRNGDPGCDTSNWAESSKPSSFDPSALDTDNWAASILDLGAKASVLTAKHGCGFAIWPTNATLPNGQRYPYRVGQEQDVLSMYAASMRAHGIGHGFYYSLTNNFFLNVCGHKAGACVAKPVAGQVGAVQVAQPWHNMGLPLFAAILLLASLFRASARPPPKGTHQACRRAKPEPRPCTGSILAASPPHSTQSPKRSSRPSRSSSSLSCGPITEISPRFGVSVRERWPCRNAGCRAATANKVASGRLCAL